MFVTFHKDQKHLHILSKCSRYFTDFFSHKYKVYLFNNKRTCNERTSYYKKKKFEPSAQNDMCGLHRAAAL